MPQYLNTCEHLEIIPSRLSGDLTPCLFHTRYHLKVTAKSVLTRVRPLQSNTVADFLYYVALVQGLSLSQRHWRHIRSPNQQGLPVRPSSLSPFFSYTLLTHPSRSPSVIFILKSSSLPHSSPLDSLQHPKPRSSSSARTSVLSSPSFQISHANQRSRPVIRPAGSAATFANLTYRCLESQWLDHWSVQLTMAHSLSVSHRFDVIMADPPWEIHMSLVRCLIYRSRLPPF